MVTLFLVVVWLLVFQGIMDIMLQIYVFRNALLVLLTIRQANVLLIAPHPPLLIVSPTNAPGYVLILSLVRVVSVLVSALILTMVIHLQCNAKHHVLHSIIDLLKTQPTCACKIAPSLLIPMLIGIQIYVLATAP